VAQGTLTQQNPKFRFPCKYLHTTRLHALTGWFRKEDAKEIAFSARAARSYTDAALCVIVALRRNQVSLRPPCALALPAGCIGEPPHTRRAFSRGGILAPYLTLMPL
jgi:hypothetical protein